MRKRCWWWNKKNIQTAEMNLLKGVCDNCFNFCLYCKKIWQKRPNTFKIFILVKQLPSSDSDISVPRQECQQWYGSSYNVPYTLHYWKWTRCGDISRTWSLSLCRRDIIFLNRAAVYLRSSGSWMWWVIDVLHNSYSSSLGWRYTMTFCAFHNCPFNQCCSLLKDVATKVMQRNDSFDSIW